MAKDRWGKELRPGIAAAIVGRIPGATETNEAAVNARLGEIEEDAGKAGFEVRFVDLKTGDGEYVIIYELEPGPYGKKGGAHGR